MTKARGREGKKKKRGMIGNRSGIEWEGSIPIAINSSD